MIRHIHVHVHDAFEEGKHPRAENGQFGLGSKTEAALKLPEHAESLGGNVSYHKPISHEEAHEGMTSAGFNRTKHKADISTQAQKSQAARKGYAHKPTPESHYNHPEGHSAKIYTSGGETHYNIAPKSTLETQARTEAEIKAARSAQLRKAYLGK